MNAGQLKVNGVECMLVALKGLGRLTDEKIIDLITR